MVKLQKENVRIIGVYVMMFLISSLMTMTISQQYIMAQACNEHCQFETKFSEKIGTTKDTNESYAFMELDSSGSWSGSILDTEYTSSTKSGYGDNTIAFKCSPYGTYSLAMQKQNEFGELLVKVVKKGMVLKQASTIAPYGVVSLAGQC